MCFANESEEMYICKWQALAVTSKVATTTDTYTDCIRHGTTFLTTVLLWSTGRLLYEGTIIITCVLEEYNMYCYSRKGRMKWVPVAADSRCCSLGILERLKLKYSTRETVSKQQPEDTILVMKLLS